MPCNIICYCCCCWYYYYYCTVSYLFMLCIWEWAENVLYADDRCEIEYLYWVICQREIFRAPMTFNPWHQKCRTPRHTHTNTRNKHLNEEKQIEKYMNFCLLWTVRIKKRRTKYKIFFSKLTTIANENTVHATPNNNCIRKLAAN